MPRHKNAVLLAACALMLGTGATSYAPFSLVHAEPSAGAVFAAAPARIRLIFSERLDSLKGRIALVAADGHRTALKAAIDPHLVDAIVAPVLPLQAGAYHVEWSVVAASGVSLNGSYVFTFGPSASPPQRKP